MLWQKIYAEHGYYCEWTDEVALLFAKKNNVSGNVVSEIIKACIRRGIFDKKMYEKYAILTSKGVQERFFEATVRRISINVKSEYLLVSYSPKTENVCTNPVNADINEVAGDINKQSKVNKKESKVYESKEKRSSKAKKNPFSDYASDGYLNDFDMMENQIKINKAEYF